MYLWRRRFKLIFPWRPSSLLVEVAQPDLQAKPKREDLALMWLNKRRVIFVLRMKVTLFMKIARASCWSK